ncbi:hypothetical protein [Streptomyces sp. AC602_WCS936]|uniref:hypothetical protein n=1 Tax=Streptomyces sp. AC602_WCS936 TaxID=2823685 RepID=UPI001C27476C|nr:hypothetical protein [Streptomyces sp. AC602_WCS936]
MLDRSHAQQAPRTDAAAAARHGARQPRRPLASLQAGAGNRAVTALLQRAADAPAREETAAAERRRRAELAAAAAERRQREATAAGEEQGPRDEGTAAEAAAEHGRRDGETPSAERRRRAELAAGAAERRRRPAEADAGEEPGRRALRGLSGAGEKLRDINAKVGRLFGTSKADRAKKAIDPPDTVATRVNAPTEGGVRSHGLGTSNAGLVEASAIQGQVGTGINVVTDSLGLFNDLRALKAGYEGREGTGPDSHKPRKDWKGKPLGAAQNSGMVVGDVSGMANAAVRNAGNLGGVPALGITTGGAGVFYSTLIAVREAAAVWRTYHKNRALKEVVEALPGGAPVEAARLQDVLDRLGRAQERLERVRALPPRRLYGLAAARDAEVARFGQEVAVLTQHLRADLADVGRYARHKQHTKLGKRVTNLGGNTVRAAGGGLAVAAVAGAVSGPAAPAVAGTAAALLLGNAVYKGVRAGSNRYVEARHPERFARPTRAQEEAGETGAAEPGAPAAGVGRGDAVLEFFKVTKSVQQGERRYMAQKLYALAAGPGVHVGKSVPDDIRASARALLKVLKAGPSQHSRTEEEWEASLNDPGEQNAWEKEIFNQLSSV